MALTDLLSGFWESEEANGSRADSTSNGLTLTDNNTVTQAVGKVGNAAQCTKINSESLSRASTALLQPGPDLSISIWAYFDSSDATSDSIVTKDNAVERSYNLCTLTGPITLLVFDSVSGLGIASSGVTPTLATWYHIIATYTASDKIGRIYVNDGAVHAGSALTNGIKTDSTIAFIVGGRADGGFYFDGRLDQVGFWQRVLTSGERTQLYNGGAGLSYAAMTGAAGQGRLLGLERNNLVLT